MSNIEKIKAEIKRLKNKNAEWRERINSEDGYSYESDVCCGYDEAIEDLESFINSLPEEKPSEDLEEAARNYTDSKSWAKENYLTPYIRESFIAGAEWQEKQDLKWAGEIHKNGYNLCKEQMMKDAEEDALLIERAWLTLDGFGHEELAGRLRQFAERKGLIWK